MSFAAFDMNISGIVIPVQFHKTLGCVARDIAWFVPEGSKILIITDERVALLHGAQLQTELREAALTGDMCVLSPGETTKSMYHVSGLLDVLSDGKFSRSDFVVAFGGGVITDIVGFAASIYHRGVNWIAVPTTLLGMVDAAIGGKTGVNHARGKNLIGTIYQPRGILSDLSLLRTLDKREIRSGGAEIVKAGLLSAGELWSSIENFGADVAKWSETNLHEIIPVSAKIKADIVGRDPMERGERKLLNFGHTFGHALEAATHYRELLHGEAVFWGLRAAIYLSRICKRLDDATAAKLDEFLSKAAVPSVFVPPNTLLDYLSRDKKLESGQLNWILLSGVGRPEITADVPRKAVEEVAEWLSAIAGKENRIEPAELRKRVLILNGPNLNLLGTREPDIYGQASYRDLCEMLETRARSMNMDVIIRQSNHEGELVSLIQSARHWANGIIINPGGYTHTSVAIRDAISGVGIPTVEVHLSDLTKREEFRRSSLIADVCKMTIAGKGVEGYLEGMSVLMGDEG